MSSFNEHRSTPGFLCLNCHTINTNGNRCIQCQSENLQEIPLLTQNDRTLPAVDAQQDPSNDTLNHQQVLVQDFQNLFRNPYDIQSFTSMLLPMLMSEAQPNFVQQRRSHRRRRRSRPPRRIKRATHTYPRHQYVPLLDFMPFQFVNATSPGLPFLNINGMMSSQVLNPQLQPNMTILQMPVPYVIFDPNGEHFNADTLRRLLMEDIGTLPLTRSDINQLPTLVMSPSNLSVNPSCAICLENFDALSEVKQLPPCHHIFHNQCLTEWLLRHGNCPVCRTTIDLSASLLSNPAVQPLDSQTITQQSNHSNPSHPPVKSIDSIDHGSNHTVFNHPLIDTPRLPRFDSPTQTDTSSNTE